MKICRVKGSVVATAHHPAFDGRKLLVVQPLDESGAEKGDSYLAVDTVQAGAGDIDHALQCFRDGRPAKMMAQ